MIRRISAGNRGQRLPAPRHAFWTVPSQPRTARGRGGRRIGVAVLAVGLAATVGAVACRPSGKPGPASARSARAPAPEAAAARLLNVAAAILSFSVLTDSAVEHYRGAFHNPAMYAAPAVSALSLANSLHMALAPGVPGTGRAALSGIALGAGITGTGFHFYNVAKREGGVDLLTLFYGAPLGAPAAIAVAGLFGLAAGRLIVEGRAGSRPTLFGRPAGPLVGLGAAGALIGTVAEAGLLHFRGAFHDPFMFVPVTLPPAAAAMTAAAAARPALCRWARPMLYLTAAAGIAGAGFHAYGVHRNMGGFRNWSQNLLNGPPLPAPPSFTGVALAGLAALKLIEAA